MSARKSILKRFDELIQVGLNLRRAQPPGSFQIGAPIYPDYLPKKTRWHTSCLHLLEKTFGKDSIYVKNFQNIRSYQDESQLAWGIELLKGAKEEIEKGLLYKIEHLMAVDLFDSVIEQAEHLLQCGFKDAAAILGRVIIENTLKEIAEREEIEIENGTKLSKINESLWKEDVYPKNVWRIIQGYVDLGNYAAHGEFEKYNEKGVEDMLRWIKETLLAI